MKKIIDIGGIDPLSLLGTNDKNLKYLEKIFNSNITVRGSKMVLNGTKEENANIESLVDEMLITVNRKGFIDEDDIKIILALLSNNNKQKVNLGSNPIVVHTHKGVVAAATNGQKKFFETVIKNDITFAVGPAGTGKTYLAVACAVAALKAKEVSRIIITRPAVEAGENLGFLPGDLKEKIDPYLTPIYDALNDMIKKDKLLKLMEQKIIEVAPLAYMRGRTLHNAFLILDEAQNATRIQMKMFLTRLGVTSKAIVTGDVTQIDLPNATSSGLLDAIKILKKIQEIGFVYFDENDVVRHKLVKNIIIAYDKDINK